jgi:hypothetical protein
MSLPITLLKQSNLIIKGSLYTVVEPEETMECMELLFTLLVNGKMVEFTNSFIIGTFSTTPNGSSSGSVGLENDGEWFLIVRILYSLGYYVDENMKVSDNIKDSRAVIEKWIQELKFQKGEQAEMHGAPEFIGATPIQYQYPNMFGGSRHPGTESMKTAIN